MEKIYSVLLAAGLSTRMGSVHTNKVCLELLKKPVICRAIEALQNSGIDSHVVVVGAAADQVMQCIGTSSAHVMYAFQPEQRGPADALACALNALPPDVRNSDTLLLVTPGHRIVAAEVVRDLLELYRREAPKIAEAVFAESENSCHTLSIYLARARDLAQGLESLQAHRSAAGELQLSELTAVMNGDHPATLLRIHDFAQVLGFTNPAEFLDVTEILRRRQGVADLPPDRSEYHPVQEWLAELRLAAAGDGAGKLLGRLQTLYGNDQQLVDRETATLTQLMEAAARKWGETALVAAIRSPGRVNVMGRHVDHQGGNCNLMTIGYETLMVTHLRADDRVRLSNLNPEFASAEFSIGELVRDLPWDDWQTLVGSAKLAKLLKQYGVNWSDYIKAVFLRFQKHFYNHRLKGMDIIVAGNVPMAAGLSSSSTLVVGAAEAVVGANRLDLQADKLVTLCGEGEWFVGTRGGAADHAAVKLGECNKVVKVGFFDFKVETLVDFPSDYALIVGDSGIKARKSSNAKDQFNHRVSCYRIGFALLKKYYPEYAERLHHLRDFNPDNLGVPLDWFYKLLGVLPEQATRAELEAMLPGEDLSVYWNNHAEPADGLYPIRGVVLFGLGECARSARYVDLLAAGDMSAVGHMMNVSHNGDRVMRYDADGRELGRYHSDTSDAAILRLIDALRSGDPARMAGAALWEQPGSYRCSLPEIDRMVDLACAIPGVAGAQLAGAGLGGCMMVMVQNDAVEALASRLTECYYRPAGREPRLLRCRPIAGAGPIRWQDRA